MVSTWSLNKIKKYLDLLSLIKLSKTRWLRLLNQINSASMVIRLQECLFFPQVITQGLKLLKWFTKRFKCWMTSPLSKFVILKILEISLHIETQVRTLFSQAIWHLIEATISKQNVYRIEFFQEKNWTKKKLSSKQKFLKSIKIAILKETKC